MRKLISFLIICLLLAACSNKSYELINTNKALEIIDGGAIILDVRTTDEFKREHITGAVNIPLDQIETIEYDKDLPIIVYCQTGIKSKDAIEKLVKMGYTKLYDLDGGLLNWGGSLEE